MDCIDDGSPFVSKLETMLLLKNVPARRVDVALWPPRPELATMLGLPYRRVPVLALGRDVYVDTALMASTLERRFPASHGHPSLFPRRKGSESTDAGFQKIIAQFYADRPLFHLGFGLLPWTRLPADLQRDRKKFIGRPNVDFEKLAGELDISHSILTSHLALCEEQLQDDREWFLDTETPGIVDASVYVMFSWFRSLRMTRPVFDAAQFPKILAWYSRMDALLAQRRQVSPPPLSKMAGADAAKEILSNPFLDISAIGFDEVEAKRLGLRLGVRLSIRPDDTGKEVETTGRLVALNKEEIVIETGNEKEDTAEVIRVHFPRLGYVIQPVTLATTKL